MAEKETKDEIKVEDRRHFDKDGNIIRSADDDPEKKQQPKARSAEAGAAKPSAPPKIDFMSLLFSYIHTALVCLGDMEDPIQKKTSENLPGAQEMIDILEVLQEKTKGNLDQRETQYLESALFDLRMRYVEKSKLIK